MQLRPYQTEAIEAIDRHLCTQAGNPVCVLPTGAGKSVVIAGLIHKYLTEYPGFRCVCLAHVQELVAQNAAKMRAVWPEAPIGIYSAGLRRRDKHQPITFASIQSLHKHGLDLEPQSLVIVDEAHRVPIKDQGQYRHLFGHLRINEPNLRIVGFTATPWRLQGGAICHPSHLFQTICYEAKLADLIKAGYLSNLVTDVSDLQPDLKNVRKRNGDFVEADLTAKMADIKLVRDMLAEAMPRLAERSSILVFCCSVQHAEIVRREILAYETDVELLTGGTPKIERESITRRFVNGSLRVLVNVQVLTEGFDAQRVDGIILARPTESKGLYYQMVGRGLRTFEGKTDCLVLDFAGCVERHGALDLLRPGKITIEKCPCGWKFSRALGECPECGKPVEVQEWAVADDGMVTCECNTKYERSEGFCPECGKPAPPREREIRHQRKPSAAAILAMNAPPIERKKLVRVLARAHYKVGAKIPTLRIDYEFEGGKASQWISVEHSGYAHSKAVEWWAHHGLPWPMPETVKDCLAVVQDTNLGACQWLLDKIEAIQVQQKGKYYEIRKVIEKKPEHV